MTQEEKAKRYDELLLKLQKAKVDDNVCDEMYYRVIDDIVPELSESEDERIRKAIHIYFDWLDGRKDYQPKGEYTIRDMIAWFEKQGEQKQDPCEHCDDKRLNCHNFPCVKKRAFKQGKSVLEAIIDEKVDNANKVEPKFKDGDVLNSPSHYLIWIYKDNEHYYACVNMNYVTENTSIGGSIKIPSDACPATKEQREQLEKAMTDAGYNFDFNKKKLKKIKQNPAWSEEDEDNMLMIEDKLRDFLDYIKKDSTLKKHIKNSLKEEIIENIEWLKSLRPQNTWKPSEEQIKVLDEVIKNPHLSSTEYNTLTEIVEQLEKLKEE